MVFICCDKKTNETINSQLKPNFYASDTIISPNESVVFTEKSEGDPTSWYWEFQGGTPATSTDKNPEIVYNSLGTFDVKLIVQDNNSSASLVQQNFIRVENLTPVTFDLTWQKSIGEHNLSELVFSFIETSDGGFMSSGSIWHSNENTDVCIVKYDQNLNVVWEKIFSGNYHETGFSLIETNDGSFIVAGSTNSIEGQIQSYNGDYDIFLLKFDINGNVMWTKSYGGSEYESCLKNSLKELADGNLIISGTASSNDGDISRNIGDKDVWLINLNKNGTIIHEKTYGGSQDEYGGQIIINNQELILGFRSRSNDGDFISEGIIVTKMSLNGEIIWVANLEGLNYGKTIIDKTGGYISLIGNTKNRSDFEIIKMDEQGSILWKNSFGGSGQEWGEDLIQFADNSLAVLGTSSSSDGEILNNYGTKDDVILAKLSYSGKLLGLKNFGGSDREWTNSFLEIGNGEFIINASTSSYDYDVINNFGATGIDNWIFKAKEIILE
ncbi:PKD domain-containing protein [Arenibacter palladensis]|uniref:PKD domain-containing protein n=1 Tax=Arenibacter palladensis TaxID=237373 RepID=UPI002FD3CB38